MNTKNKTAKNIQVGDLIAIGKNCYGYEVALCSQEKKNIAEFVTVVALGNIVDGWVKQQEIVCANGKTYFLDSNATRYITEVK